MATITFKGESTTTVGDLPEVGRMAPDFLLTKEDLSDVSLKDFGRTRKILNIVPSLDTGVCAASAKAFNSKIGTIKNAVVLTVSVDLPFAQKRFCDAEGTSNIIPLSQMRDRKFGIDWGVEIKDGPLAGLFSRAVVILDEDNTVLYTEQVSEIGHEPDYKKALDVVRS
jgi:thiol peroxidase